MDRVQICRYNEANIFRRESADPVWEVTRNSGEWVKGARRDREEEKCKFVDQGDEDENPVPPLRK